MKGMIDMALNLIRRTSWPSQEKCEHVDFGTCEMDAQMEELERFRDEGLFHDENWEQSVENILNFQLEDGSFGFDDPNQMPSDARVDYVFRPSYVCCQVLMRYLLEGEKLRVFTRVHNPADTPLYCNFGSHEAYAAGGEFSDWSVRFEHTEDLTLAEQKGGYLTGAAVPYAQGVRPGMRVTEADGQPLNDDFCRLIRLLNQKGHCTLTLEKEGKSIHVDYYTD